MSPLLKSLLSGLNSKDLCTMRGNLNIYEKFPSFCPHILISIMSVSLNFTEIQFTNAHCISVRYYDMGDSLDIFFRLS